MTWEIQSSALNRHAPREKAECHKHYMGNKTSLHEHSGISTFTSSDEHSTKLMTAPPNAAEGIITESCGLPLWSPPFNKRERENVIMHIYISIEGKKPKSWSGIPAEDISFQTNLQ